MIDDGLSDIVAGRFDAGIRVGERLEKDMIAVRLTPDVTMLAVASPDYLARPASRKHPLTCRPRLHQLALSPAAARSIAGVQEEGQEIEMPWKVR